MSIRSKILATVAGIAAVCAAVVATPGQNGQAHASNGFSVVSLSVHSYAP